MTRTESKKTMLDELGAVPVVVDALDPDQVAEAVRRARPDVIVHQLTALAGLGFRNLKRGAAVDKPSADRGDESPAVGRTGGGCPAVRRGEQFRHIRGHRWAGEERGGPARRRAPGKLREGLAAIRHLEQVVLDASWTEGIVLRYGGFYGPGTNMAPGGESSEMIRKRRFPLVGDGAGVALHPHRRRRGGDWRRSSTASAASTTLSTTTPPGSPYGCRRWRRRWAPKRSIRVPRFVVRAFAGEAGVVMMTDARGASNAEAKRELAWRPADPSWRQGSQHHDDREQLLDEMSLALFRDRLPDARQRFRGRGRGAGSAASGASGT